jgi:tRNA-splicing ligase RtcB
LEKITDKLLVWGREGIEWSTLTQANLATTLPFVRSHVALMPDAHRGIGATVGSVIPTEGAIVPSFAGVDLGCGMIATHTAWTAGDLPSNLDGLMSLIEQRIPAGVGKGHLEAQELPDQLRYTGEHLEPQEMKRAAEQYGSLGSGNHFVELCLDENDHVWLVLHSGSRGIGNLLARKHMDIAKGVMKKYFIEGSLADPDLAYFVEGTPEFDAYIRDMHWAQDYAFESRVRMKNRILGAMVMVLGYKPEWNLGQDIIETINCHHNYTQRERHMGRYMWITRKGAINAGAGVMGVIPGSMGTDTYIVRGLGNPASYNSSSHGAGRKMSRTQARKELDLATFEESMAGKTWNAGAAGQLIDEDPRSYKDIREVMAAQADLTEVVHHLRQVLNYKGVDSSKGRGHQ